MPLLARLINVKRLAPPSPSDPRASDAFGVTPTKARGEDEEDIALSIQSEGTTWKVMVVLKRRVQPR